MRDRLLGREVQAVARDGVIADRSDAELIGTRRRGSRSGSGPARSDSTLVVILVPVCCAWTKAPRNAAPSGPFTVPVTVAAWAGEPRIGTSASVLSHLEAVVIALLGALVQIVPAYNVQPFRPSGG